MLAQLMMLEKAGTTRVLGTLSSMLHTRRTTDQLTLAHLEWFLALVQLTVHTQVLPGPKARSATRLITLQWPVGLVKM